jgi:hypothetical protein
MQVEYSDAMQDGIYNKQESVGKGASASFSAGEVITAIVQCFIKDFSNLVSTV